MDKPIRGAQYVLLLVVAMVIPALWFLNEERSEYQLQKIVLAAQTEKADLLVEVLEYQKNEKYYGYNHVNYVYDTFRGAYGQLFTVEGNLVLIDYFAGHDIYITDQDEITLVGKNGEQIVIDLREFGRVMLYADPNSEGERFVSYVYCEAGEGFCHNDTYWEYTNIPVPDGWSSPRRD